MYIASEEAMSWLSPHQLLQRLDITLRILSPAIQMIPMGLREDAPGLIAQKRLFRNPKRSGRLGGGVISFPSNQRSLHEGT